MCPAGGSCALFLGASHLEFRDDVHDLLRDFDDELKQASRMYRYIVRAAEQDFKAVYDQLLQENSGWEDSYNGGDAVWDAEVELGMNPWTLAKHLGFMTLVTIVALAEIVLARLGAACWQEPKYTVYPSGKTWSRRWEGEFYRTCLKRKFDPDAGGFGALRALRDLYAHGYGVPVEPSELQALARRLYGALPSAPPTRAEIDLGFDGAMSFFGEHAKFSHQDGLVEGFFFRLPKAELTPLAVHRSIECVRSTIAEAGASVVGGTVDDVSATRFARTVSTFWERRGGIPAD